MIEIKLLICPNMKYKGIIPCVVDVVSQLEKLELIPMLTKEVAEACKIAKCITGEQADLLNECDVVVAIGGDGAIFHTAFDALEFDKPVLGINAGRLGFLSQMEIGDLSPLKNLKDGSFEIRKRMVLSATFVTNNGKATHYAINDVVISRHNMGRIIDLEVSCGGKVVSNYQADGLIFSTPTGSTAYSMSAGGPIIDPSINAIVMTPVCPHSLFNRSIVFSPDKCLITKASMPDENDTLYVAMDGREIIDNQVISEIIIEKANAVSKFINLEGKTFYETLNKKLKFRG